MKRVTHDNYRSDTLYPRVSRAVQALLDERRQVSAVGVFMKMGMLMEPDYHAWRVGRVPYLERVIKGNLSKASRVLRILSYHARVAGLQPVLANYMGLGNARVVKLRFSKSGERPLEETYRRHFVPFGGWLTSANVEAVER
jgi:hypothetical protein